MKIIPWPLDQMKRWYEVDQMTVQEISDRLSSDEFQLYWRTAIGAEYRPGQKIVNKVAKRCGFAMRKTGAPGHRNNFWAGGRTVDKHGYILVKCPDHPLATKIGYVREHRLIAEERLGRYLLPTEVVHHIDENPANNDPANLLVYETNGQHLSETMTGVKVPSRGRKGRPSKLRGKVYVEWPVEMMIRWYTKDRLGTKQIAELLNRTQSTVGKALIQGGVTLRKGRGAFGKPIQSSHRLEAARLPAKYRNMTRRDALALKRKTLQMTG